MLNRRILAAICVLGALASSCSVAADRAAELATELEPLFGTRWYGVYFSGRQKCGFARTDFSRDKLPGQDVYTVAITMDVTVSIGGPGQRLVMTQTRQYKLTGELAALDTKTKSLLGETDLRAVVKDDKLVLTSAMAGHTTSRELPAPKESLESFLAAHRLIRKGELGAEAQFELFEPTFARAFTISAKLLRFEERLIGGIKTRVGVVQSTFGGLGITSTDYVTPDGETLETVVSGIFTLRKEPEKVAKDVRFAFDALRAGIIPAPKPLGDPPGVAELKLKLSGIPKEVPLIDDDCQKFERGGEGPAATHTLTIRAASAPKVRLARPVKPGSLDKDIARWLEPSEFTQSDAPEIIDAARKIVGDTTDSFDAATKIGRWVYENVKKKGLAAMSNALAVLKKREGDCSEHSVLFVALCRAAGIPARQAVGIGYSDHLKGFGYHAWAEVYVGAWVAVDPTWGEPLADATHVKFGVGDIESMGVVAALFGSLKLDVVDFKRRGD